MSFPDPATPLDPAEPAAPAEPSDPVEPTEPDGSARGLARAVIGGDRRALARAITLVESARDDDQRAAVALLAALGPQVGPRGGPALRIGISGAPGVGKSTLLEALGGVVTAAGHRLAVLAVDPSSDRSGGSILGDKTRMARLAADPASFVRPSPSGARVGGVGRRTREAMVVCEAAGYDVVVVETVGAGQRDVAVAAMVDLFVLLVGPGAGDALQGVKRGSTELADVVVVTKADGDTTPGAVATAAQYRQARQVLRSPGADGLGSVRVCSALTGDGVAEIWGDLVARHADLVGSGALARIRGEQLRTWLRDELTEQLLDGLGRHCASSALLAGLEPLVAQGRLSPRAAARRVVASYLAGAGPGRAGDG